MAGKRKKERQPFFDDLAPQTKQAIASVVFGVLGIFFVLSALHVAGTAGDMAHGLLKYLFGIGFVLAPLTCFLYVIVLLRPRESGAVSISKMLGITVLLFSLLGLIALYHPESSGVIGRTIMWPLSYLFGNITTGVILGAFLVIGILLTINTGITFPRFKKKEATTDADIEAIGAEHALLQAQQAAEDRAAGEVAPIEPATEDAQKKTLRERVLGKSEFAVQSFRGPYDPPPLSLVERDKGKARVGDVKASANIIKRTLQNFGIQVEMDEVSIGPTVTRYALKPAEGVRIAKIVSLQSNLELALAASPVRIEAPIPGKSLVGIEVPNTQKSMVGMGSLLSSPEFTDSPKPLLVALGKDISGSSHFSNIAKMPHLLIAGTTGSGKSVMIHTLVASLLYRNSPEQLRFIMIDPKRVELTFYNSIPHLLTPVITDAKKAIMSLKWAAKEMERRYEILQREKVRDINSYHESIYKPALKAFEAKKGKSQVEEGEEEGLAEPMPYIVIIIDELADVMQAYPRELEAAIVRLAQMSRAVGIHLVLSTQRPSVNVITGLIKANIPGRIAFQVASQIDSRTILDQPGAEKLLGAGDMLYISSDLSKPVRIQSAFISEAEVKAIAKYLKEQSSAQNLDSIDFENANKENADAFFESAGLDDEDDDELYEEVKNMVMKDKKASTSYIQRRFRIGYSRAARLMDLLEERGIIGPQDGARPREILMSDSTEGSGNM